MFPFPGLVFLNGNEHAQSQRALGNLNTLLLAFRICASRAVCRSYLYGESLSQRSIEDLLQVQLKW